MSVHPQALRVLFRGAMRAAFEYIGTVPPGTLTEQELLDGAGAAAWAYIEREADKLYRISTGQA